MNKTIAIFGGSQEQTFKKLGSKVGCQILFHGGKTRNGGNKKEFRNLIKKSDCVVVLLGACNHESMYVVKDLCKSMNKEIVFHKGFGATGAIQMCLDKLNKVA